MFIMFYARLRKLIQKLYYNFEVFQCEWLLNEYNDFKDDLSKQHDIWNFKL